jgi:type IV pilus assembly protein PilQ
MRTEYIAVNYSNAQSEILPHIQNILTEGRGKANVDQRSNLIVITDTDRVIKQAKAIVQRLDKVTPQVRIEARVVEVNSDISNELGIQWSLSDANSSPSWMNGTIVDWDVAMNFPAAGSGVGFQFANIGGSSVVLDAQLNALETMSKGKVISSPSVTTMDNKTATIKQGLEVGYYERDDSGGSSTAFKNVDLLLEVTPHVTPDNRVSMTVYITKNDISGTFNNAPLLSTNEVTTEFLVNDGATLVIGGILKKTETYGESGLPVLKDFPGLSWLFSTNKTATINQELLVFITPKIVTLAQKPVE